MKPFRRRKEKRFSITRAFRHVAGIVGAIGCLDIFDNIVTWRNFIVGFIHWWHTHVRPFVHEIFWWIPEYWPWPWPDWGYDYIVFAITFGLGGVRFFELFLPVRKRTFKELSLFTDGTPHSLKVESLIAWDSIRRLLLIFVVVTLLWPMFLTGLLIFALLTALNDGFTKPVREALFIALSPFIYFMGLLMANFALRFFGVN